MTVVKMLKLYPKKNQIHNKIHHIFNMVDFIKYI